MSEARLVAVGAAGLPAAPLPAGRAPGHHGSGPEEPPTCQADAAMAVKTQQTSPSASNAKGEGCAHVASPATRVAAPQPAFSCLFFKGTFCNSRE